jgi:outer membrane protein assembly factor BamE
MQPFQETMARKMKKILGLIIVGLLLSGCSVIHPYRPSIQQGNVINMSKIRRLKLGMSQNQVVKLLGNPILTNTFDNNRLAYVYTLSPNNGPTINKRLFLTFKNNRLVNIEKHL